MSSEFKNLPVEIPNEDYHRVKDKLYHGQMSHIYRNLTESLGELMDANGKGEIYKWLDGEKDLVIPPPKRFRSEIY